MPRYGGGGSISFTVDADAWLPTIKAIRNTPAAIKREVARRGKHLAEPLAKEIRASGRADSSRHANRVADTVESGIKDGVPAVTAGGLPYTMGSEFGGRKRYRFVRSPVFGNPPLKRYRKHTTMQFREHKEEGYWFTEPLRTGKGVDAVMIAWRDLVDDVIEEF